MVFCGYCISSILLLIAPTLKTQMWVGGDCRTTTIQFHWGVISVNLQWKCNCRRTLSASRLSCYLSCVIVYLTVLRVTLWYVKNMLYNTAAVHVCRFTRLIDIQDKNINLLILNPYYSMFFFPRVKAANCSNSSPVLLIMELTNTDVCVCHSFGEMMHNNRSKNNCA